jgi:hypothetical protein
VSEPNADLPAPAPAVPGTPPGYPAPAQPLPTSAPLPPPPGYVAAAPEGPPAFPTAPPAKKKRTGLIVGIVIAVVAVLIGCLVVGLLLLRAVGGEIAKQPQLAEVDDCLGGGESEAAVTAEELEIVGCGDAKAWYQVVEKIDGKTQAAAELDPGCTDPSTVVTFWFGEENGTGSVLCLKTT